jgi:BolA protein
LEIIDESSRHAHHGGRNGIEGDETHFHIAVVADAFTGVGRLARSRLIHEVLAAEFSSGLHALSLTLRAPGEG